MESGLNQTMTWKTKMMEQFYKNSRKNTKNPCNKFGKTARKSWKGFNERNRKKLRKL